MIEIRIPPAELWDKDKREFFTIKKEVKIALEHSLVSISKWEAKWHKPFLVAKPEKTLEETISYIECMSLTKNIDPRVFYAIPASEIERVQKYINDPQTARKPPEHTQERRKETIYSETVYYWMIEYNIPSEYRKWNLNRLLSLIDYIGRKKAPAKKMSASQKYKHYAQLNEARKKAWGTKG